MLAWLGRWVAGSFGWVGGVMELLGVPQQNAHSVLPREGAEEGPAWSCQSLKIEGDAGQI